MFSIFATMRSHFCYCFYCHKLRGMVLSLFSFLNCFRYKIRVWNDSDVSLLDYLSSKTSQVRQICALKLLSPVPRWIYFLERENSLFESFDISKFLTPSSLFSVDAQGWSQFIIKHYILYNNVCGQSNVISDFLSLC